MSVVTNIILSISILDKDLILPYVDGWIKHNHYSYTPLRKASAAWNGYKEFESSVYIGAYNHFDRYTFREHVFQATPWTEPMAVQLLDQTEDEIRFNITAYYDYTIEMHTSPIPNCIKCARVIDMNKDHQVCMCGRYYRIHWWNSTEYSILGYETNF